MFTVFCSAKLSKPIRINRPASFHLKGFAGFILSSFLFFSCTQKSSKDYAGWSVYGGNKEANHYSSLTQIDTNNVSQLQVAWTHHTGDADSMTQIQVNSIVVDSTLYGVSPKLKLFALNAATGNEKWIFDPMKDTGVKKSNNFGMNVCRGVTFYSDNKDSQRIFYSANSNFIALTQKPEPR